MNPSHNEKLYALKPWGTRQNGTAAFMGKRKWEHIPFENKLTNRTYAKTRNTHAKVCIRGGP
jgi:hypothetical protein